MGVSLGEQDGNVRVADSCRAHSVHIHILLQHLVYIGSHLLGLMARLEADVGDVSVVAQPVVGAALIQAGHRHHYLCAVQRRAPGEVLKHASHLEGDISEVGHSELLAHHIAAHHPGYTAAHHAAMRLAKHLMCVARQDGARKHLKETGIGSYHIGHYAVLCIQMTLRLRRHVCSAGSHFHDGRITLHARCNGARRLPIVRWRLLVTAHHPLLEYICTVPCREPGVESLLVVQLGDEHCAHRQTQCQAHHLLYVVLPTAGQILQCTCYRIHFYTSFYYARCFTGFSFAAM